MSAGFLTYGCAILIGRLLLLLPLLLAAATPARAQPWSATASLASDYRLRGISLNHRHAAPMLDLGYALPTGWSFGLGLASLDRDAAGRVPLITLDASRSWQLDADWGATLGGTHWAYAGSAQRRRYDHDELRASVQWRGLWSATLAFTPSLLSGDGYGHWYGRGSALAAETSLRWPLGHGWALDGGIGLYGFDRPAAGITSYVYGSAGLAWARGPLQGVISYVDSNAHARRLASRDDARAGWIATLSWGF